MKIAVVGVGTVGKTLVEHFQNLGHEVLPVDIGTEMTLETAARAADAVFIVVLPIEDVSRLISEAASVMRQGTLLIHGTSIERPMVNEIVPEEVLAKGIAFCHFHFQFRPEVPLSRTIFGQHISISIQGDGKMEWLKWILGQFEPFSPIIHRFNPGQHDQITAVSQLVHMIVAIAVAHVWDCLPKSTVRKAMEISGPPGRLLMRSMLRVGTGARVTESTILNHPLSQTMIEKFLAAFQSLQSVIGKHKTGELTNWLDGARTVVDPSKLKEWDARTAQLARLEADTGETHFEFRFRPETNRLGLLAGILQEFDGRGVDKTTTIAQTNPDWSCVIIIGVREPSDAASEAEAVVRGWIS